MAFLESITAPLLAMNSAYLIVGVSIVLSLVITLIYKWMTDQTVMKSLKEDIKQHQNEMKKNRDNPKKVMQIQKQAMEKNMKYMMKSMKPTIVTFIPLILVFGWLNAHFTYNPVQPGMPFSVTATFQNGAAGTAQMVPMDNMTIIGNATQQIVDGKAVWTLKGDTAGTYLLEIDYNGSSYTKEVQISDSHNYASPSKNFGEDKIKSVELGMTKLRVFGDSFSLFGWYPGWLGVYIIVSLVSSMGLRKLMKLY